MEKFIPPFNAEFALERQEKDKRKLWAGHASFCLFILFPSFYHGGTQMSLTFFPFFSITTSDDFFTISKVKTHTLFYAPLNSEPSVCITGNEMISFRH